MRSEVLERAKEIERDTSSGTNLWIKLSLLQDLIAELERLLAERPLRSVVDKLRRSAEVDQNNGGKPL